MNATHSAYARNPETGQVVDTLLASQGKQILRLKRVTGAVGTRLKSRQESGSPWNMRVDYNLNLTRVWDAEMARDTSRITHALSARGGVNFFKKFKVNVNTGFDLARKEMTPTNLNFYVDLHCWEFTFNWIPFGVRQSFSHAPQCQISPSARPQIGSQGFRWEASLLDKLERSPHQPAVHHHGQAHQRQKSDLLMPCIMRKLMPSSAFLLKRLSGFK